MEKQPRCVLMLSPQEIALRRIAVVLLNEPDILALIGKIRFRIRSYQKEWLETVECKVTDKLSKLQLPESIMRQMIHTLKPIGSQILKWKFFHESFLTDSTEDLDAHILEKLCFTTSGTVDYRKTAEALVCSDVVDIVKRYKLACLYCLEDYIPDFWNELPEENKMYFYNDTTPIEEPRLWFCWPYILKGEEYKLDYESRSYGYQSTFRQFAFEYSAIIGNKAASEYFFQRLTHEEREPSIIRAAQGMIVIASVETYSYPDAFPKEKVSDVVCYLLSLMTSEQQMQIFKENPFGFLRCFLDWPWQDLFLDNADVMWTLLRESDYSYIWTMSKNVADRVRLVTSERVFTAFYYFIWRGRWQWVEVCLREAKLSKEDKKKLKEDFTVFLSRRHREQIEWVAPKCRRFFEFLDETDASAQSKRSSDDETLTEAKKPSLLKRRKFY
ncbi:hypothetical protein AVEN_95011-1 [Araneus ventricosus]|uniref:Uncharacterized protein n=1 Tax=Araneus ventricosus TaxID=182803 RepID=A0A4Y2RBN7_ARAVE|nr:hypothetical protein AVEN_95011-1 [Araneus ventricosus]